MNPLHDDGPTTATEGLEYLELLAQDHYSIDPNLRTAVDLVAAALEANAQLEKVCEAVLRHFDECSVGTDTPEMLRLALGGGDPDAI